MQEVSKIVVQFGIYYGTSYVEHPFSTSHLNPTYFTCCYVNIILFCTRIYNAISCHITKYNVLMYQIIRCIMVFVIMSSHFILQYITCYSIVGIVSYCMMLSYILFYCTVVCYVILYHTIVQHKLMYYII